MHLIKLSLGTLALVALQATILATPALAQSGRPHVVRLPPVVITARPCVVRQLDQGSGSVRMCGAFR